MIEGVKVTPLRQILDERGKIMHMMRSDREPFQKFGEIYFSCVHPGAIKAWHIHSKMILNYAVPHGNIKFVLYDNRPDSPTKGELQQLFLCPDNYCLVTVPPMVWNGFKGYGSEMAIVANCSSIPHDPDEIDRMDPFTSSIPYDWGLKHG
ncbi:dTDP-4-dehydrorhamnose 3,5-epimerase family protein [Acaryochloris sp. IP29b_bin.137]|uniref:dTDP-4-dehydrorhamnose 3,5-epimerase family protein n=1 Tax=Acaryochloris sp. IP29b_bin.137 TaxID=2969217 RepID=UPI00261501A2|nr:dTDP-4-dehydrorhamnose 3,5-epimerase family protein [Acaryochloris sp. IP29b_bin.137]